MAHPLHRPDIYRWKRFTRSGTPSNSKVRLTNGDINQWMKRVEMASEFAISEVFKPQKAYTGKPSRAVALQNTEQLQDHDDAYHEAQTILSDWMNRKLRLELEMDEDGEEFTGSNKTETPDLLALNQSANLYENFDDMYSHLAQEDESFEVHNFLQDLMEREVLDSGIAEDLGLDAEMEKKRGRDPGVTMELRHRQVKESRLRRDAERERRRQEEEVRRNAREEARRLERAEQRRKQVEAHRQEELLQQEVMRLRREMQARRRTEQLARKMEKERLEKAHGSQEPVVSLPDCGTQRRLYCREQQVEARIHILHLQCMQKHFSSWYAVVLERRVRLGKAAALCDWRRQLRAWRAWRALVWAKREEREAERTEEELRMETRQERVHMRCQVAVESDRKRLMRRCLNDWRLWCRMEKEHRELLSQQDETKRKIADLISAAASGKLTAETCRETPITALHDNVTHPTQVPVQRASSAHAASTLTDRTDAAPTQAWQVTSRHAALSPAELHQARHGQHLDGAPRCRSAEVRGGRFEHRHAVQQQTIAEQRRRLREQQELISQLQEKQTFLELRQEAERTAQTTAALSAVHIKRTASLSIREVNAESNTSSIRSKAVPREQSLADNKAAVIRPVALHPAVQAMEERALQRTQRRREIEEMKRRREEERLAQMKAAEEMRQRQEEEEKRLAAERRKEERRKQKERELEKQKKAEKEQQLLKQAGEHYHRALLLHRGLAPWKRLVQDNQSRTQKAVDHYKWSLQRHCLLSWLRVTCESLAEKEACADQLYKHILLRRAIHGFKRVKHVQTFLGDQAEQFFRVHAQTKAFKALLDHATNQRLASWEHAQRAAEHSVRHRLRRCFSSWRRLPEVLRDEREREVRRQRLRRTVAEILPDFRFSPVDSV